MIKKLLMCPPTYFGVEYTINPWMTQKEKVDRTESERQWRSLKTALGHYATVELVDPVRGLPDFVFTANAGWVWQNKVMPSHFMHRERQPETLHFQQWFQAHGYQVLDFPADICFEGAGDALWQREKNMVWMGHGFRSHLDAQTWLEQCSDMPVIPLLLVNTHFYHLDTCFCTLLRGEVMYYPAAFDAATNRLIEKTIPEAQRIIVSDEEAYGFVCNAVVIAVDHIPDKQGVIFMPFVTVTLQERLNRLGYEVIEKSVSEFKKAGGAIRCLTLEI